MSHSSVTFHHQWSGRRTEHKRYTPAHSSTQTFERDTLQEHVSPGATLWLLDEGHVCFYAKCRVFFQEVMNRCIPENGGKKKKMNWWCWFAERSVSFRSEPALASSHTESWNETSEMLLLFNRCHISFKTLERDSQEGFSFHSSGSRSM